jgi:ABC-type sulfate transport system permease subunit
MEGKNRTRSHFPGILWPFWGAGKGASLLTLLAVVTLVIQEFIKSKEPSTEIEEKPEGV